MSGTGVIRHYLRLSHFPMLDIIARRCVCLSHNALYNELNRCKGKWLTILRAQWTTNPNVYPHFTVSSYNVERPCTDYIWHVDREYGSFIGYFLMQSKPSKEEAEGSG